MEKLNKSPVIYPLIKNKSRNKNLRVEVSLLDRRLEESVYNDSLFKEHLIEVSIALDIPLETVTMVIKSYCRSVLHLLHSRVSTYTRIVIPNMLMFRLHTFKHKNRRKNE